MGEETSKGLVVFEGIVAILFGIAAVFWPHETIKTLLYLFATFVIIIGVLNVMHGVGNIGRNASSWFLKVLLGVLELGVGVYLLRHPSVTFATFILLIGFTLIFNGVFRVVTAFSEKMSSALRTMLLIVGALGVVAGIVILFQPVAGGVAFVWILGLYALITGPVLIASAVEESKR